MPRGRAYTSTSPISGEAYDRRPNPSRAAWWVARQIVRTGPRTVRPMSPGGSPSTTTSAIAWCPGSVNTREGGRDDPDALTPHGHLAAGDHGAHHAAVVLAGGGAG